MGNEYKDKLVIKLENTERASTQEEARPPPREAISSAAEVKFESDDFSQDTKQRIGEFFKREIDENSNLSQARITNRPEQPEVLNDSDPDSFISPHDKSFTGNEEQVSSTARISFEDISNSKQFNYEVSIKSGESTSDQNENFEDSVKRTRIGLYNDLNNRGNESILAKSVENLAHENARFSSKEGSTPFITPDNPTEDLAGTKSHIFHQRLGVHSGHTWPTRVEEDPQVSMRQLRDLGLRILVKSSGEAVVPEDTSIGQITLARSTATLVPGIARLGLRISSDSFRAGRTLSDINPEAQKAHVDIGLEGQSNPTYGNVNNPLFPFSSVSSTAGSVISGVLLSLVFSFVMEGLAELLDSDSTGGLEINRLENIRRSRLGSYKPTEQAEPNFLESSLGQSGFRRLLVDTDNDYSATVRRGLQVFFGTAGSDGIAGTGTISISIAGSAIRITEAPGFYVTILRGLVRAFGDPLLSVANGVAGLAGESINTPALRKTNYDVDPLIGAQTDPFALLDMINVIKESKFLKFMNILAVLGDTSINTNSLSPDAVSTIDALQDTTSVNTSIGDDSGRAEIRLNPAAIIKKSRLSTSAGDVSFRFRGNPMAWGSSTIPSLFLAQNNRVLAEKLFTGNTILADRASLRLGSDSKRTNNKRLSAEDVSRIEEELDSYYMPFYFHDLRTNEIIAFQAFLDNMSDSLSAEYAETQGFGRIGTVYTYKNTNRSISLSFKIVATGKEDFSQMWYKINKLTMLLFPQYTSGRSVKYEDNGEYKFTQPFTQLPAASPMIRLRVGDVFKSNYSDLDLARLFGVGQENFSIPEMEDASLEAPQRGANNISAIEYRQSKFDFNVGEQFIFKVSVDLIGNRSDTQVDSGFIISTVNSDNVQPPGASSTDNLTSLPPIIAPGALVTIQQKINDLKYRISLETVLDNQPKEYSIEFLNTQPSEAIFDFAPISNQSGIVENPVNSNTLERSHEAIEKFFSTVGTDSNPIFKSFESTRGQGVAGFIKNLSFDWNDALWETEGLNHRAPKWVTVQIDFAPVFDLNPGLDSDGNMIAPLYNVGSIMQALKVNRDRNGLSEINRNRYYAARHGKASIKKASNNDNTPKNTDELTRNGQRR